MSVCNDADVRPLIEAYVSGLVADGTVPHLYPRVPQHSLDVANDVTCVLTHAEVDSLAIYELAAVVRKRWLVSYSGKTQSAMIVEALTEVQCKELFAYMVAHGNAAAVPPTIDGAVGSLKRARDVADTEARVNKNARIEGADDGEDLPGRGLTVDMRSLIRCFLSTDEREQLMLTSKMFFDEENAEAFWKSACADVRNFLLSVQPEFPQAPSGAVLTLLNANGEQDYTRRAYRAVLSQVAENMVRATFAEMERALAHKSFQPDSDLTNLAMLSTAVGTVTIDLAFSYNNPEFPLAPSLEKISFFKMDKFGWKRNGDDSLLLQLMRNVNDASVEFERKKRYASTQTYGQWSRLLRYTMCYMSKRDMQCAGSKPEQHRDKAVDETYTASCALREALTACYFCVLVRYDLMAVLKTMCDYENSDVCSVTTIGLHTGGDPREAVAIDGDEQDGHKRSLAYHSSDYTPERILRRSDDDDDDDDDDKSTKNMDNDENANYNELRQMQKNQRRFGR